MMRRGRSLLNLSAAIRALLPGGDSTNRCSGAYGAGIWVEGGTELALTGGSAALKGLAKQTNRAAVRRAANQARAVRLAAVLAR